MRVSALLVVLLAACVLQAIAAGVRPPYYGNSQLDCGASHRSRRGLIVACTITVVDRDGNSAKATSKDFDITTRVGDITWADGSDVASEILTFTYVSPQSTSVQKERIGVTVGEKQKNIVGSPLTVNLYGIPSELTDLSCEKSVLAVGESMECTVALYDGEGVPTSGFGADFVVSTTTNDNVVILPTDRADRSFYTFTYTAPAGLRKDVVSASLKKTGAPIQGSPINVKILTPASDQSTLSCDKASLTAGEYTTCTISIVDDNGEATAAAVDRVKVTATSRQELYLPKDELASRSTFTFLYIAPADRKTDTITAVIEDTITLSASVSIATVPALLSNLKCTDSVVRAGVTTTCTLNVLDINGRPTLGRSSDFVVSTADGTVLRLATANGKSADTTLRVSYTAPAGVARDTIMATLAADGSILQGAPWNVVIVRNSLTSAAGFNTLAEGQQLVSASGKYKAQVGSDGNLVIFTQAANGVFNPTWTVASYVEDWAAAARLGSNNFGLVLNANGQLAVTANGRNSWSNNVSSASGLVTLTLNDVGALVETDASGKTLWTSSNVASALHKAHFSREL